MQVVKKIDCNSVGKVYALFMAVISFFTSLGIAFVNLYHIFFMDFTIISVIITIIFNFIYGILVGLISAMAGAIIGYISGYVMGWIYNKTVKFTGGIKMDLG